MVKNIKEIYHCQVCGNLVEVLAVGGGQLVCCQQPMILLSGNTTDASLEKHVPVIKKTSSGYQIIIGDVEHPMTQEHYIEWIALHTPKSTYRQYLSPGQKPMAEFCYQGKVIKASCYCNLHSLWKKDNN